MALPPPGVSDTSDVSDRSGPPGATEALAAIHESLWDSDRHMVRMAPGVAPGADLAALGLHAVRETALGAFLDLDLGDVDRAVAGLREVLALQHELSDRPWSGTFPVTAEQPEPPGDRAQEWVHFDPNWRQFLGCILQLTLIAHGDVLPDSICHGIEAAVARCVAGEPTERIPEWYTNPNLMHAWLQASSGDPSGVVRAEQLAIRFRRAGDVDEYNSPTYDGIDLFALALWVLHPPSPEFAAIGAELLDRICARISSLYHPALGAVCGPYLRAHGLDLRSHVSLLGMWLHLAGEPSERVLPSRLDEHTDHVHDLYFLPLFQRVAVPVLERLHVRPVEVTRSWRQVFENALGGSTANSVLRPRSAVGWEHGRRHAFSREQYVPFVAHAARDARTESLGLMLPDGTVWADCVAVTDDRFQVMLHADHEPVGVRLVASAPFTPDGDSLRSGPYIVTLPAGATSFAIMPTLAGFEVTASWRERDAIVRITVAT